MIEADARAFEARLREVGFRDLHIEVEPCAGRFAHGPQQGQPRTPQWYASVHIERDRDRDRLTRLLAEMGATRQNTDVIKDREVFRFTRIPEVSQ